VGPSPGSGSGYFRSLQKVEYEVVEPLKGPLKRGDRIAVWFYIFGGRTADEDSDYNLSTKWWHAGAEHLLFVKQESMNFVDEEAGDRSLQAIQATLRSSLEWVVVQSSGAWSPFDEKLAKKIRAELRGGLTAGR
jgi:hypothetical protein